MRLPRVGYRSRFLIFLALLDLLYGLSLWRPVAEAAQSPSTRFLASVMPLPWWAALWLAVGVTCLAGAVVRGADRVAFAAAGALKVLWGSTFLLAWMVGAMERGWVASVIWLAFAAVVSGVIAPWPEPDPRMPRR